MIIINWRAFRSVVAVQEVDIKALEVEIRGGRSEGPQVWQRGWRTVDRRFIKR